MYLRYLSLLELDYRDNDGNDMMMHYERPNCNQIKSKNSQKLDAYADTTRSLVTLNLKHVCFMIGIFVKTSH